MIQCSWMEIEFSILVVRISLLILTGISCFGVSKNVLSANGMTRREITYKENIFQSLNIIYSEDVLFLRRDICTTLHLYTKIKVIPIQNVSLHTHNKISPIQPEKLPHTHDNAWRLSMQSVFELSLVEQRHRLAKFDVLD